MTDTLVLREQSCPMLTWTISAMLWYALSLGLLVTSQWTRVHKTKEELIMQPYTLIMVLHYQQGLDQANWDGTISVLILLYVSNEKC